MRSVNRSDSEKTVSTDEPAVALGNPAASEVYMLDPAEKRGERDPGILRFTWCSLLRVAEGHKLDRPMSTAETRLGGA